MPEFTLAELARRLGGRVHGDPGRRVGGVATLEAAGPRDLSFLTHPRYREAARTSRAGAILVGAGAALEGRDLVEVADPYLALAEVLECFYPSPPFEPGVHPDARIGRDVRLGLVRVGPFAVIGDRSRLADGVVVGAGCVLGEDCVVGEGTRLEARVVLYPGTRVGARCIVHAGAVLGADGFGFVRSGETYRKLPQVGRVVVEDDVEIGANAAIDRAMLGETVVGRGSKLDDLVMVAHGVRLGPSCLLAGQSGIAGSARVGARVTFAGQSGSAGHLEIGDECIIAAKSAVFDDLPPGSFVAGIPAVDHRQWKRAQALVRRLPELRAELRRLRQRVAALERRLGEGER